MRFLFLLAILLPGCTTLRDTRLDGTWVSDRETTVAYNRTISPKMNWDRYSQLFGFFRLTYDSKQITSDLRGQIEHEPLRIVRKEADSVTLRTWDTLEQKYRNVTVHFIDADTYWLYIRDSEH